MPFRRGDPETCRSFQAQWTETTTATTWETSAKTDPPKTDSIHSETGNMEIISINTLRLEAPFTNMD